MQQKNIIPVFWRTCYQIYFFVVLTTDDLVVSTIHPNNIESGHDPQHDELISKVQQSINKRHFIVLLLI